MKEEPEGNPRRPGRFGRGIALKKAGSCGGSGFRSGLVAIRALRAAAHSCQHQRGSPGGERRSQRLLQYLETGQILCRGKPEDRSAGLGGQRSPLRSTLSKRLLLP